MSDRDFMGERGDTGDRGITGERGPKGDHGQHGERGAKGSQGETGEREPSKWAWLRLAAFILLAAASIFAAARTFEVADQTRNTLKRVEAARVDSRNQICLSDEREHKDKVTQLRRTYNYIEQLPPKQYTDPSFNQFIILQLPQTEKAGQTDTAPDFCDVTRHVKQPDGSIKNVDVGLPEPDPVVPKRPAAVDKAYKLTLKLVAAQQKKKK